MRVPGPVDWRRIWPLAVFALAGGGELLFVLACLAALLSTPDIPVRIERGEGDCPWVLAEGGQGGPICVLALAGVELHPASLVQEAGYLADGEEFRVWAQDQDALVRALRGHPRVELSLSQGDTRFLREVPVVPWHPGRSLAKLVASLITTLAMAGIGLFVFRRKPRDPAAQALLVFCGAMILAILPTTVGAVRPVAMAGWQAIPLYHLNLCGNVLGAVAVIRLLSIFPLRRFGRFNWLFGFALPGLAAVGGIALELVGVFGAVIMVTAPLALGVLLLIGWTWWRDGDPVQKLKARWVLWGLAVPVLVWGITRLPMLLGLVATGDPTDIVIVPSLLAIPLGIAAAVLRHRLLDIEVVVRRTLLGTVVTVLALFVYYLGLSLFARELAAPASGQPWFYPVFLTALVLTFVLVPAQSALERVLDRLFFRNRFHYRRVLSSLPDELEVLATAEQAARRVLERVGTSMETRRTVVLLRDEAAGARGWRWSAAEGVVEEPDPPRDGAFWEDLATVGSHHLHEAGELGGALDAWMGAQHCDLALAVRTPERLEGVLATSVPVGTQALSAEDASLLRTVAASLGMALGRARAYETIRRMNAELEQRVEERTAQLEGARLKLYQWEKMASLGLLAAGVSHELNTPLGVVLSTSDQLVRSLRERPEAQERDKRLAALCHEAAQRASDIVRNLRSFSRPESAGLQPVDLHELVDSTLRLLEPGLRSRSIEVTVQRGAIPQVTGFPALLAQAIANLCLNAVAAVDHHGWIRITTEPRPGELVAVIVEDSGPGVPPEIRGRIFEPFFTTKAPGQGTGLGLSLVYTFVTQHGGRIWEEGRPGEGARFVIELPVRGAPLPGADPRGG